MIRHKTLSLLYAVIYFSIRKELRTNEVGGKQINKRSGGIDVIDPSRVTQVAWRPRSGIRVVHWRLLFLTFCFFVVTTFYVNLRSCYGGYWYNAYNIPKQLYMEEKITDVAFLSQGLPVQKLSIRQGVWLLNFLGNSFSILLWHVFHVCYFLTLCTCFSYKGRIVVLLQVVI